MGILLAELIAYVGDQLAKPAGRHRTPKPYLLTPRSRISLRRHACWSTTVLHDGCTAAPGHLHVSAPGTSSIAPHALLHLATARSLPLAVGATTTEAALILASSSSTHAERRALPRAQSMSSTPGATATAASSQGATEATLLGSYPDLQTGDVLISRGHGPQTGVRRDADLRHVAAVRLTRVATQNGQGQPLVDPLFEAGTGAPSPPPRSCPPGYRDPVVVR